MAATDGPLFSTDLISPEVLKALPEGYGCRPLEKKDYANGFLDVLRVLTTVGDITEEQWNKRYDWMSARNDEYFLLCITDSSNAIVGTGALIVERKFIHQLGLVGHIEDIAVAKDQQGKKLGLRIIQALDFVAEKVGCYKTILDCSEANEGFYVKSPKIPSGLPPELWLLIHSAPANFAPQYFLEVTRNLLANPNLTASHLARAELSYQSFNDATFNPKAQTSEELAGIVKHLRAECRPRLLEGGVEGYELEYTVVRKLVPRNPKLDESIMQTCHLFVSEADIAVKSEEQEETVKAESTLIPPNTGVLSIHYDLFPTLPLDNRLARTALKLLDVIHKHSRGRAGGYTKRVHHDQVIGQKRFQDTYAYLKGKYARVLIEGWVEQTPAEKHVFEDLGIAAFLHEVWVDMYGEVASSSREDQGGEKGGEEDGNTTDPDHRKTTAQAKFPGFVDIGCGNGLLVHILNNEGWHGWGFDARRRKTWDTFPPAHTAKLHEMLLVPAILQSSSSPSSTTTAEPTNPPHHNGIFPPSTFIISNHADELTPWTPLLAHLNTSPFIAIPCCSHDLAGTRFRAPVHAKHVLHDPTTVESKKNKAPSAYASLCSWLCHLTEKTGFVVEREHLRIPSTRNIAVLGRRVRDEDRGCASMEERLVFLRKFVEKEMGGQNIAQVREAWMKSGDGLLKPGKGGH
ncbi:AdoMet-MTase domain-containing protein [Pyrenophora tritici-repentis]|nr:AdoMet-MTase domain-containing protein [Pyrenophora tritici-repentis]KAI0614501.1 AdoMet-MTase domain-containing protein [Pyrenophora tritici-repentis]